MPYSTYNWNKNIQPHIMYITVSGKSPMNSSPADSLYIYDICWWILKKSITQKEDYLVVDCRRYDTNKERIRDWKNKTKLTNFLVFRTIAAVKCTHYYVTFFLWGGCYFLKFLWSNTVKQIYPIILIDTGYFLKMYNVFVNNRAEKRKTQNVFLHDNGFYRTNRKYMYMYC